MASGLGSSGGPPPGKSDDEPLSETVDYDASVHRPHVLIVDESVRAELFAMWLDDFAVKTAISARETVEQFDETVAVALVRNELSDDVKSKLQTLMASNAPFCRTIVTTTERVEVMYPGIEYDVCLSEPTNKTTVTETVERLLLRTRYDANLRNYYEYSMFAANREVQQTPEQLEEDGEYRRVKSRMETIKDCLDAIMARFDTDDLNAVQQSIRPDVSFGSKSKQRNKRRGEKYRPDKCVGCGLEWGVEHDSSLGEGYERLGAFVWECSRCGAVQNMPDPSHRRVAWR